MCRDMNVLSQRAGGIIVGVLTWLSPFLVAPPGSDQVRPALNGVLLMPLRGLENERKVSWPWESQDRAEVEESDFRRDAWGSEENTAQGVRGPVSKARRLLPSFVSSDIHLICSVSIC